MMDFLTSDLFYDKKKERVNGKKLNIEAIDYQVIL